MESNSVLKKIGIISCAALLGAAITAGAIVLAGGIPTARAEQPISTTSEAATTNLSAQAPTSDTENHIGEAEATAIALAHAGVAEADVSHLICRLDYDDGMAEYDVEFWDGAVEYDYEVNAMSGEIMGYDHDMESYNGNAAQTSGAGAQTEYIGEAEATAIALAHAGVTEGEASYIKCEFDLDDGRAEYEVEWQIGRTEYEYTVSALDGTIWEHNVEYDD